MNYIEFLKFSKSGKEKQKNKNTIYPDSISEKYSLIGDDIRKLNDLDSFADYVEFCMKSNPIFDLFITYGHISKDVKTYKDMTDGIMNHFITFVWEVFYIPLTNCFYEEKIKECVKHGIDGDIKILI